MIDQAKDCPTCRGTTNEVRAQSPYPTRKILFRPCPACGGSGKAPVAEPGNREERG